MQDTPDYIPWTDPHHQISVHTYTFSERVYPHTHDYYELVFIAKGSAIHHYHGKCTVLIPGDCFIIPPHKVHAFDVFSQTVKYNCLFYPEAFGKDWDDTFVTEGIRQVVDAPDTFIHLLPTQKKYFERLLEKLCQEIQHPLPHSDLMLRACMSQLFVELLRAKENLAIETDDALTQREVILQALTFIEQNYMYPLTTLALAEQSHLSESYFRSLFKQYVGLSPIAFINKLRIDHAHFLLTDAGFSITQASEAVGITDTNYFSRLYKKTLGHPPSRPLH